MSLTEYLVMFVLVAIMGAGIPGPGDASWRWPPGCSARWPGTSSACAVAASYWSTRVGWIGMYVGLSYFLGAEVAERIGDAGSKVVLGVLVVVAAGLAIKAGVSRLRAGRQG